MMAKKSFFLFCCGRSIIWLLLCFSAVGCGGNSRSTAHLPPVADLEVERYLGVWYEIARLPHRFERDMDFVSAEYRAAPSGNGIRVINRGYRKGKWRESAGVARLRAGASGGELEVSFFRPFYGAYRIIRLDPEYTLAVVTSSTVDHLWLLARTPTVPEEVKQEFLNFAGKSGFAVEKIEFPRQTAPAPPPPEP